MIRRAIAVLVVMLFVAAGVVWVQYRMAYGTFAWWQIPPRISWCGRHYLPAGGRLLTRAEIAAQPVGLPGEGPYPVVTVAHVPPLNGRPVLAARTPESSRRRVEPPLPCAMGVFLQTGTDQYLAYTISGGP